MEHVFARDRTKRFCSLCLDAWPSSEVVTKFHSCTICGVTSHTGCLSLAKTCPYKAIQRDKSTGGATDIYHLNRLQGSVFIKIVQAEDLITTTSGTSLFGIVRLLTSRDQDGTDKVTTSNDPSIYLESNVAVVDESDRCVWNQGADGFIDVENDDSFEIVRLRNSSIDDISGINTNNQNNTGSSIRNSNSNLEEDMDVNSSPYLQLDVKRRMMINIFDSTIAGCEISILPLMLHPNVMTERWFALTDFTTGEICGKILVRLLFASSPTDTGATVETEAHDQKTEEKKVLSLTGTIVEQHLQQHHNEDLCNLPAVAPAISTVRSGNSSTSTNTTSQQKLQEIMNKRKELLNQTKGQGLAQGEGLANIMSASSSTTPLLVDAPSVSDWLRSSSSSNSGISQVANTLPSPAPAIDLVSMSMTDHNSINSDHYTQSHISENDDSENSTNRIISRSANAIASTAMHHSVILDSTPDAPAEPDLSIVNGLLLVEMEDRDDVSEVFIDNDEDDEDSSEDDNAEAVQAELEQLSLEIHHMAHDIAATYPIEPFTDTGNDAAPSSSSLLLSSSTATATTVLSSAPRKNTASPTSTAANDEEEEAILKAQQSGLRLRRKPQPQQQQQPVPLQTTVAELSAPVLSPALLADWFSDLGTQTVKYFEALSAEGSANVVTTDSGRGTNRENDDIRGGAASTSNLSSSSTTGGMEGHPMVGGVEEGEGLIDGVGRVHVRLIAAFKSRVHDAADGDHYVTASIEGMGMGSTDVPSPQSFFRSQTVTSSATPVFNRQWTLPAPHYKACLRLYLMDANTDRKVATARMSLLAMQLRDIEHFNGNWRLARDHVDKIPMFDPSYEAKVLSQPVASLSSTQKSKGPPKVKKGGEAVGGGDLEGELGHFLVSVAFEEDLTGLFLNGAPREAPPAPEEQLSVERLGLHIERFKSFIGLFTRGYKAYRRLMDWEDPFTTGVLFVAFVWTTCRVNAEYALSCPIFVLLALVTKALLDRRSGAFKEYWVNQGGGLVVEEEDLYQPVLSLRIAIVGFRNLPDVHTTTTSTTTTVTATASTGSRGGREGDSKSAPTDDPSSPDPIETRANAGTKASGIDGGGRSGSDSSSENLQREEKENNAGEGSSGGYTSGGRKKTTTRPPFVRVVYLPMADDELKLSLSDDDDQALEVEVATNKHVDESDLEDSDTFPGDGDESEGEGEDRGRNRAVSSSSGNSGGVTGGKSGVATHQHASPRSPQSPTQAQRRHRSSNNKKLSSSSCDGAKQTDKSRVETGSGSGLVRGRRGLNLAARREFLVGCVGLHSTSGPSADATGLGSASTGTGFSKLMASLSLTRADTSAHDALLHNMYDPWCRRKENQSDNSNVIANNNNAYDRDNKDFVSLLDSDDGLDIDLPLVYPILQPVATVIASKISPPPPTATASTSSTAPIIGSGTLSNIVTTSTTTTTNGTNAKRDSTSHHLNPHASDNNPPTTGLKPPHVHTAKPTARRKRRKYRPSGAKYLLPWSRNTSVLKLTMFADNPHTSFLGDSSSWGSTKVFVKDIVASALSDEQHQGKGQTRGSAGSTMFGRRGKAAVSTSSSSSPYPGVNGQETSSFSSSEVLKWFDIEYSQTFISGSLSTNDVSLSSSAISTTIIEELQNSVVFKTHDYASPEADVPHQREGTNHSSLRASADSNDDTGTKERNTLPVHLHAPSAGSDANQEKHQQQHKRKASSHKAVPTPQVLLRMQVVPLTSPALDLDPRAHLRMNKKTDHRLARDVEASLALQQLLRPANKGGEGSTLSTLWNMRDNVKYIQNLMAWILHLLESVKHIFTWAIPNKTFPLYLCLIAVWLVTVMVPGRWLILVLGLFEFLSKFLPPAEGNSFSVRASNLLASLPNDDDLEQIYREDRRACVEQQGVQRYRALHSATLHQLLQCTWSGPILLRADAASSTNPTNYNGTTGTVGKSGSVFDNLTIEGLFGWTVSTDVSGLGLGLSNPNTSSTSLHTGGAMSDKSLSSLAPLLTGGLGLGPEWREAFLVVQGRRLVWWAQEGDIDAGRACQGQLLLYGHAGTTQASPVVVRELERFGSFEPRLLCVFGRDAGGLPLRCTLLCADDSSKGALAAAIGTVMEQ